ncbi:hypothetical protein OG883_33035 [Streptomyces sp. NBC_01142]|uniref:hypothetical protein n=1 Tax=Streptomyces sp. NBC_01142 TaxID=2975865 RepID=UPI00225A04F1|nr:hypothetical protein [Streptomyces sp. NBC_01142]MCX4824600.1 hypothetical protein [Streptomyces sp. NBC_01142]
MQKSTLKKWSARIAASTVIAATAALVPAATAQAGTPQQFRLCNYGRGYDTIVEFPNRGGYAFRVLAGKCTTTHVATSSNEPVKLYAVQGLQWPSSRSHLFAGFSYDDKRGIDITTRGTYGAVNWSWR